MNIKYFMSVAAFVLTMGVGNADEGFVPLFNGKNLDGWHSAKEESGKSNNKFSVDVSQKAIHVYAGVKQGDREDIDVLYTDTDHSKFVLKLQYKWGEKRYKPRVDWDRDSGLLFHINGDINKVWPDCMEMQMGESPADKDPKKKRFHTGDLFVIGKDLKATVATKDEFYDEKNKPVEIGKNKSFAGCYTKKGVEKAHGEWNEIELRVDGNKKAVFILNGEEVLTITDMKKKEDGKDVPLTKGRIGIQAEYAELYFRNIEIKSLDSKK